MLSIVICTHNRDRWLGRALNSLENQSLPASDFEVIVIDNASNDDTLNVVEQAQRKNPSLIYVREDRLGLSFARNTGIETAKGEYIAFLDDDAVAVPDWAWSILSAFENIDPPPAAVGGPVELDWDGPPPTWLPKRYWSVYTSLDLGKSGHFLENHEYLVGANMAYVKSVLIKVGGFNIQLGRKGKLLLSGEEADILKKIKMLGEKIYFEPDAKVVHSVPQSRQNLKWLYERYYWDGASQPLLDGGELQPRFWYAKKAAYDLKQLFILSIRLLTSLSPKDTYQQLDAKISWIQRLGRLRSNLARFLR